MVTRKKQPTFAANRELARWVPDVQLGKNGRISSAAYIPADGEKYLSVNSVELESLAEIAKYCKDNLQRDSAPVAISCLKITEYTRAASAGGVLVNYDAKKRQWLFDDRGTKS